MPGIAQAGSSLVGAFSTRLLIAAYTGPVISLRLSSGGAAQPFFTDSFQSYFSTGPGNTGLSLASWAGSATPLVDTWYDQSGNGNNAATLDTTTASNIFLTSNTNGVFTLQFQQPASSGLQFTTPVQPTAIYTQMYNTNAYYGSLITAPVDYTVRFGRSGTDINGDSNGEDWFYTGAGSKVAFNNGSPSTTITLNAWNAMVLSVESPVWQTSSSGGTTTAFSRIGYDSTGFGRGFSGSLSEMVLLSGFSATASSASDYWSTSLMVKARPPGGWPFEFEFERWD